MGGEDHKLMVYAPRLARDKNGPWSFGNNNPLCMVDSGASANFVSRKYLERLGGTNHITPDLVPKYVQLANGSSIARVGTVTLYIKFQYMVMAVQASILPTLQEYDLILGMPWLQQYNPSMNWVSGVMHIGWQGAWQDKDADREEIIYPVFKGQWQEGVWVLGLDLDDALGEWPQPGEKGDTGDTSWWLTEEVAGVQDLYFANIQGPQEPAVPVMFDAAIAHLPQPAQDLLREFADRFDETQLAQLPPHRDVDHNIQLHPGSRPSFKQPYRMSQAELDALRVLLDKELASGKIRPSRSPFAAPVLFSYQPGKKPRLCYDYRALNLNTVKHRYPLPRIEDLLDKFHAATVFTKLDLAAGFNQIRIKDADVHKAAFVTRYGQFETLVMPFGVCNGPATFQQAMNSTLHDLLDRSAEAYIDDVAGYSPSFEQHLIDLRAILERFRRDGWVCRLAKCQFFVPSMLFAGHQITGAQPEQGLPASRQANPDKVQCVTDWGIPADAQELQRFLGLVNYFAAYIADFSTVAAPLHYIQRKGVAWEWGPEQQHAYDSLKLALVSEPVLVLPDPSLPFVMHTDSSKVALGAVLMQEVAGELHPVMYSSHMMSTAEVNYPIHDQECLSVVHHLRKWRHYLMGGVFTLIQSDHKSLDRLFTTADLCSLGRQARWMGLLANFHFEVHYLPGAKNVVADCLSRPSGRALPCLKQQGQSSGQLKQAYLQPVEVLNVTREYEVDPHFMGQIRAGTAADPALAALLAWDPAANTPEEELNKLVVPRWLEGGTLEASQGLLYLREGLSLRLVIPPVPVVITALLMEAHDATWAGHLGRDKTLAKLKALFVWQGMYEAVNAYVTSCLACQQSKKSNVQPPGQARMLPIPNQKWESISMDFITGLPPAKSGNDAIWTVVDKLSKRVHFIPIKSTITAVQCAEVFKDNIFKLHGMPRVVLSDRDSKFTSAFWKQFCTIMGIKQVLSTPFHPQTDGQSEVANKSIETMLRAYVDGKQSDWEKYLSLMEFAYNDSVHSGTGFTPFFLEYGVDPLTPLALINKAGLQQQTEGPKGSIHTAVYTCTRMQQSLQAAKVAIKQSQSKQQQAIDKRHSSVQFTAGDQVMLATRHLHLPWVGSSRKLRQPWVGPFTIVSMKGDNAAELELPATMKCHNVQNVSKLKHFHTSPDRFAGRQEVPPATLFEDGHEEFTVEEILGKRGKGGRVQYLVKWLGYPVSDCEWASPSALENAWDTIVEYEEAQPNPKVPVQGVVKRRSSRKKVSFDV
jgi:RNase H-like domain found in reverse transcriptase/Integrase zinc binding domain/Reverse transcriptase (RNA-dependent DNA polymerase)/Integrase core domain/Chromo (CHRromatin Organisation MOdifier) domain/gag-polyprotein putative aspartyl protease